MKIAISIAHGTNLNGLFSFERAISRVKPDFDYHVYIRQNPGEISPIDNYTFTGTTSPFYADGHHADPSFYKAEPKLVDLTIQPTLYGWWMNDHAIRADMPAQRYDAVISLITPDCLNLKTLRLPDYGFIRALDSFGQAPISCDVSQWIAKPSDYSRLACGWKFFRFVNTFQLGVDEHRNNGMELSHQESNYLWRFWVSSQRIRVFPL